MFTLEITESAESDLDRITDYLGVSLSNPQAAVALLDEIDRVSLLLEEDPAMYPLCKDSRLADLGYHKVVIKSYLMIYEIDFVLSKVRVLRFFHGSEDYANKL